MKASVGDRIVTASGVVGGPVRDGVIVGCPHEDGSPPYRVRWADTDEESLVLPGPDSLVQAAVENDENVVVIGEPISEPTVPMPARAATWQVQVTVVASAGSTTAEAVLVSGPDTYADVAPLRSVGHARKNPDDEAVAEIGSEVAAGRALRRLADVLLSQAQHDITAATGEQGNVHP